MGHQRSSSWEFKLQMIQLLEKGELNCQNNCQSLKCTLLLRHNMRQEANSHKYT